MVKNSKGGSGAKKMGRKFQGGGGGGNRALRLVDDEDEMYAAVSKIFGNGMCDVMCNDGKSRLCIIRNKFRGRGKRDNTVALGTWVMVGIRSWESVSGDSKTQKCDLLEVYNDGEKEKLKKVNGVELARLAPDNIHSSGADQLGSDDSSVIFSNIDSSTADDIIDSIKQDNTINIIQNDENKTVCVDDI